MTISFKTISGPRGLSNGQFNPWVVKWLPPDSAANGFVIQQIQYQIEATDCGGAPISPDDIWNQMGYDEPVAFNYWESWQIINGVWQGPGNRDSWIQPGGEFFENPTSGKIVITGAAGFYELESLDQTKVDWGRPSHGDDQGSPMSGDLFSTTTAPNLSLPPPLQRTMTVTWDPCNSDSGEDPTLIELGPPGPAV